MTRRLGLQRFASGHRGLKGLTWRSRREPEGFAYVLFADRCPVGCLEQAVDDPLLPPADRSLASGPGRLYVEGLLVSYRVALM